MLNVTKKVPGMLPEGYQKASRKLPEGHQKAPRHFLQLFLCSRVSCLHPGKRPKTFRLMTSCEELIGATASTAWRSAFPWAKSSGTQRSGSKHAVVVVMQWRIASSILRGACTPRCRTESNRKYYCNLPKTTSYSFNSWQALAFSYCLPVGARCCTG